MDLWTRTEILFGVGEEIVRTGTGEIGTAYFGVGDGELGLSGGCASAHELF